MVICVICSVSPFFGKEKSMRRALMLLVGLLASCAFAGYDMRSYVQKSVKADTGFEVGTLQYIWDKYNKWNGSPPG